MTQPEATPYKGYNSNLPSGYDIRDHLTGDSEAPGGSSRRLGELMGSLAPIPEEWITEQSGASSDGQPSGGGLECLECRSYRELTIAWRKALKWIDGLDHALATMLASIVSVKMLGDPLWIKVVSPPSTGKSILCEAISVNRDYVFPKSTLRGFHSGYKADDGGSTNEDNGLIPFIRDKTFVLKDGDTLLQLPNLQQVLSEARDIYDGTSRSHYRNKMGKDHSGIRMTWILCGTESLKVIDESALGERFLDCIIMDTIDDELEDEIGWRAANQAARSIKLESDGDATTQDDPEMVLAKQLTGGYVGYLRENAPELLGQVDIPEWVIRRCQRLGKFIAYMRARPGKNEEFVGREFSPRLIKQMVRLATCLAVVLNQDIVDEKIMRRVKRIALDTSSGKSLKIATYLYEEPGLLVSDLMAYLVETRTKVQVLLRFLKQIGVVQSFQTKNNKGVTSRVKWKLTETMNQLYQDAIGEK